MSHNITSRKNRFYQKVILTSDNIAQPDEPWKGDEVSAVKLEFPAQMTTVVIANDNHDRSIEYSYDGLEEDGELFCDDGPFSQDGLSEGYVYLRLPEGTVLDENETVQVRVWAWRGGTGR